MNFALTLLIAAGILILPVDVQATPRVVHAEWAYQYNSYIAGFRLYYEKSLACESADPNATSMECSVDAPDGEAWFTLTTFFQGGAESQHSAPFSYIFASDLKAVLAADTLTGDSPLPVTFDATSSTGNIVSHEWLFGDGETGTGDIANHTFTAAGTYTVTLTITDDTGAIDRETAAVVVTSPSVANTPPVAVISSSASVGDAPLQVQFDGTGSSDIESTVLSYTWDMGDGETAVGPQVTYTYSSTGTFSATLTVTDEGGLTDSISTPVIVSKPPPGDNILPQAVITASTSSGYGPLTVSFDAAKSNDPDGEVSSYTWNFGDGSSGSGVSVKHEFSQPAIYTITLKVTDNMGAGSRLTKYIVTVLDPDKKTDPLPDKTSRALQVMYNLLLKPPSEQPLSDTNNKQNYVLATSHTVEEKTTPGTAH